MTVIITGAAGMIGSRLAADLLNEKYNVVGVDRRNSNDGRASVIIADLNDTRSFNNFVVGAIR